MTLSSCFFFLNNEGTEKMRNPIYVFKVILVIVTVTALLLRIVPDVKAQEEKKLLSEAISILQSITPDLPIKDRISKYDKVLRKLDLVTTKHGATDTGIKLKTSQSFGNFKVESIRSNYLKDVFDYNDKVCKTSPSYKCLGFVSLKNGAKLCRVSKDFESIEAAHKHLRNAIQIFKGQNAGNQYVTLALEEYRSCNKGTGEFRELSEDFFRIELVRALLMLGEKTLARGQIEKIKVPYFKFESVLLLKSYDEIPPEQDFIDRMKIYIDSKMPSAGRYSNVDSFMASLALGKFVLSKGPFPIEFRELVTSLLVVSKAVKWGRSKSCDSNTSFYQDQVFSSIVSVLLLYGGLDEEKKGMYEIQNRTVLLQTFPGFAIGLHEGGTIMAHGPIAPHRVVSCSKISEAQRVTIILMADLIDDGKLKEAKDLYNFMKKTNPSYSQILNFYIEKHLDEVGIAEFEEFVKSGNSGDPDERFNWWHWVKLDQNTIFSIFKKHVDFGNVCEAADTLFVKLRETTYYTQGVDYMVNSISVVPTKKYNCGDEDLELLLQ
jgi:hypothetical protein